MRKTILFAVLFMIGMAAVAQSKKELQDKIAELEKQNRELYDHSKDVVEKMSELSSRVFKLQDANQALKEENAQLKEQLAKLQAAGPKEEAGTFISDSIAAMLLKFYSATTVEERAKYVVDPQRVMPKMQNYYKAGIKPLNKFYWVAGDKNNFHEKEEGAQHVGTSLYSLLVELVKDYNVNHIVIRTPQGFKLDWEATVQYGETKDYMLTQANVGKTFTFHCKMDGSIRGWNDSYSSVSLSNDLGRYINRYSKTNTKYALEDTSYACFPNNSAVYKKVSYLNENCVDEYGSFDVIVKAKVDNNGTGEYFFELMDIVSETPSMIVTKRLKKQQQRF